MSRTLTIWIDLQGLRERAWMNKSWLVDSPKLHEFADHFSDVAQKYAEFRPRYPRALFKWLASVVQIRNLAWDCATGNGQAATGLAEHFRKVVATDASDGQLQNAIPHERVEYRAAAAHESGLADRSVDLGTVAQALHWFDRPSFYVEAKRVLRPGAIVAVWCYGHMQFGRNELDRPLTNFYKHVVGPYWPPERVLIETNYRTIEFPFREFPTPEFRMEGSFTLESLAGYLRTWSATQRYMRSGRPDPVPDLVNLLERHWPKGQSLTPTMWPISLRTGRT